MKQFLITGLAISIALAWTTACCFATISPAMSAMPMAPGSEHCHSEGPPQAESHDATGDEPLLPCCSSPTDTRAILNEGSTLQTFHTVTAAMLPEVAKASSTVKIHGSSADIYQLPPGRHGFLHDLSILRI